MSVAWKPAKSREATDNCRIGRYSAFVTTHPDGNLEYGINVRHRYNSELVLKVNVNPAGPDQINAHERCEYLMQALNNNLNVVLLPEERNSHPGTYFKPHAIPMPPDKPLNILNGVVVGGMYKHLKSGNVYAAFAVTNVNVDDPEKWPSMVVYRDLRTTEVYSRTVQEFLSGKYELLPEGALLEPWTSFRNTHQLNEV